MDKVRFGIIGIGVMGTSHAQTLYDGKVKNAVLTAVCDVDPARIAYAKEHWVNGVSYFDDAEALMTSGTVDAVFIATPHYDHPPLAIKAFSHGLHVMSEKPAGVYTAQVEEMNAAAKASIANSMSEYFFDSMCDNYIADCLDTIQKCRTA